jgi:hypothetical protein
MNIRSIRKKLIFLAGDIRREHCPLWFAVGKYEHLIGYDEALEGLNHAQVGYIGLHRNRGDLSNVAINGFMKHAWIHEPLFGRFIIEAVSEGVFYRHALHGLMSDYAVLLKPLIDDNARGEAWERASTMVGCPYDDTFTFDLENETEIFKDKATALDNMRKYGLGVSCTELVALCYVGHRRELGLYRTKIGEREAILPDAYLSTHFEVVWASKQTTPENALILGLHEEGCSMLREYWEKRR